MSTIQDQIRALQRKQATIDCYQAARSQVESLSDPEGHEGVVRDVAARISSFIEQEIAELNGQGKIVADVSKPLPSEPPLSAEELSLFRTMVRRQITRSSEAPQPAPYESPSGSSEASEKSPLQVDPNDKLRFLLQHRHFEAKQVVVQTKHGPVEGKVVGLDAPNIVVQLETGYTVGVLPEKCQIK